jgi:hypothetical protein
MLNSVFVDFKQGREAFCYDILCIHNNNCGTGCSPNNAQCCFFCSEINNVEITYSCSERFCHEKEIKKKFIKAYKKWLEEKRKNGTNALSINA